MPSTFNSYNSTEPKGSNNKIRTVVLAQLALVASGCLQNQRSVVQIQSLTNLYNEQFFC